MKASNDALALIRREETFQGRAYRCPAGIWTIGYGHTGPDVREGMQIDEARANELLREDIAKFETGVTAALVGAPVTQGQLDALVSFAFNVGLGNLRSSALIRKVRSGKIDEAAGEFLKWVKARNPKTGQLRVLPGLVRRRSLERALFLGQSSPMAAMTLTGCSTELGEGEAICTEGLV